MSRILIILLGLGVVAGYGSAVHQFHAAHTGTAWSCHHSQ